jgi:hypothetical protein
MTETLLSPSNILLYGRKVEDLEIVEPISNPAKKYKAQHAVEVAYFSNITPASALAPVEQGVRLRKGMRVLLANQTTPSENGLYKVKDNRSLEKLTNQPANQDNVYIAHGTFAKSTSAAAVGVSSTTYGSAEFLSVDNKHNPFSPNTRGGLPSEIEQQLDYDYYPILARIYGFSFEGTYYDLPRPMLFLVHGEGIDFVDPKDSKKRRPAQSPADPSISGVAAADFDYADDIRVWSYDKADYTIRMDIETGMFEDILLPIVDGGGPGVSGARVSGARVSGARVSGARVSGARVSGARLSGGSSD